MQNVRAAPRTSALASRLIAGVAGGIVGGLAFGVLMQMMDMLAMVAMLVDSESVGVGWLVHLFNSALFGVVFGLLLGRRASALGPAVGIGLIYGVAWWVLGALLIMPAWLGMSEMVFALGTTAWQSLTGHLVYGLLLGMVYSATRRRLHRA